MYFQALGKKLIRYTPRTLPPGLNLSVPEHSVFGFVGENGAGKTTTMKIILGLLKSDRGVGLLPAMVHWWLFGVWIIGLIVLFSVLVKSYTGVLLGTVKTSLSPKCFFKFVIRSISTLRILLA